MKSSFRCDCINRSFGCTATRGSVLNGAVLGSHQIMSSLWNDMIGHDSLGRMTMSNSKPLLLCMVMIWIVLLVFAAGMVNLLDLRSQKVRKALASATRFFVNWYTMSWNVVRYGTAPSNDDNCSISMMVWMRSYRGKHSARNIYTICSSVKSP